MKNLVLLCALVFSTKTLFAQPGPQGGGLLIRNLYFQEGRKLMKADSSMVAIRRFLLTSAADDSPIAIEWSKKVIQPYGLSGFVWLPSDWFRYSLNGQYPLGSDYSTSRLYLRRGRHQMVVDFNDVFPANPAGQTEILDTLVFKPGYFRVRLGQMRSQGHQESVYLTWPHRLVQRNTSRIRRTSLSSLLP